MFTKIMLLFVFGLVFGVTYCSKLELRNGKYYLFSNPEQMSWYAAIRYCLNNSMFLIDIPTFVENEQLLYMMFDIEDHFDLIGNGHSYWTSGTDLAEMGYFYWETTGQAFNHTDWLVNEPIVLRIFDQHCVRMFDEIQYKWKVENCEMLNYAVCRNMTL